MPSTRLSDIEEAPGYEAPPPGRDVSGSAPRELESDYYLGGYDIDSDYPPPHEEEFLSHDQLPPPLPSGEDYPEPYSPPPAAPLSKDSTLSSGRHPARPHFHPSQYLPPHQPPDPGALTPGNGDADDSTSHLRLSVGASSASDVSAPCGDSEHGSDFDSMDELRRGGEEPRRGVTITTESQQQTEV